MLILLHPQFILFCTALPAESASRYLLIPLSNVIKTNFTCDRTGVSSNVRLPGTFSQLCFVATLEFSVAPAVGFEALMGVHTMVISPATFHSRCLSKI